MDLNSELEKLKRELASKNKEIETLKEKLKIKSSDSNSSSTIDFADLKPLPQKDSLDNAAIARYSRQLLLPEIGMKGQIRLANTSVLIVGAGGLGCPAAIYLAACGIGRIGIIDYDNVEMSNLQRQILHTELGQGKSKAHSVFSACHNLNSTMECIPYHIALKSDNALDIITKYDIILDCTDNVATRYLLNDACVLSNKPLVSGSALRMQGQLTVYNYDDGPCYRCLFPIPPPSETVTNCSDGGVLGVVPGIIGNMQALEAIKIAIGITSVYSQRLCLFDAVETSFRSIKLRPRQMTCSVCGVHPTITKLIDYEQFCGASATDNTLEVDILNREDRVSCKDYHNITKKKIKHILIDVRESIETEICSLPSSLSIPLKDLNNDDKLSFLKEQIINYNNKFLTKSLPVYVVCHRGNDSQVAVEILKEKLKDSPVMIKDIIGGLSSWSKQVDSTFPVY